MTEQDEVPSHVSSSRTPGCKGTRILWILPFLCALLWLPVTVWAQERRSEAAQEPTAKDLPRVALGDITGTANANLMIPLYYTPDPKTPLSSLTVEIDYVSNSLKFQKALPGAVTEEAGAEVQTTLTDGVPEDKVVRSKLRVAVALTKKQDSTGLPEGLLAYLMFRISPEAKPFAIKLNTSVIAAEDLRNPPQKVDKVHAQPGLVVVELLDAMPEATCFFFTH